MSKKVKKVGKTLLTIVGLCPIIRGRKEEEKMDRQLQNLNQAFDEAMEAIAKFNLASIELRKTINEDYLGRK